MADINETLKVRDRSFWTTDAEIEYINKIGTFHATFNRTPIDYLKGYIKSLNRRTTWGAINKCEVMTHALQLLEQCESGT